MNESFATRMSSEPLKWIATIRRAQIRAILLPGVMEDDTVVIEGALRCRGIVSTWRDSSFQGKNRVRVSSNCGDRSELPVYSLSAGSSGRIKLPLGIEVESITSYSAGTKIVIRLNYGALGNGLIEGETDKTNTSFFELEFDGGSEGRHLKSKWEGVLQMGVASAICNHYYQPTSDTPSLRLSEDLLEMAIYRLNALQMGDRSRKMITQGEFLLKIRRQMSELLMRLQNGGIDFISSSEVERLHRLIESKRDKFLSNDSDVQRIGSVYAAMKKLRAPSTKKTNSAMDAHSIIDEVVQSLIAFPIYPDDSESDSGESSYCSHSSQSTPTKYPREGEEIETGNDVFVEASSVVVCAAVPTSKLGKKNESMLPVAVESPTRKRVQVATPIKKKSSRRTNADSGAEAAKRKLFEIGSTSNAPFGRIYSTLRKWIWTIIFGTLLVVTLLSTPLSIKGDFSKPSQQQRQQQQQSPIGLSVAASRGVVDFAEMRKFQQRVISIVPKRVISIVPKPTLTVVRVRERLEVGVKSPTPWFVKLWNRAKQARKMKRMAAEAILISDSRGWHFNY